MGFQFANNYNLQINKLSNFWRYHDGIQTFNFNCLLKHFVYYLVLLGAVLKLLSTARGLPTRRCAERGHRIFCKLSSLEMDPVQLSLPISLFRSTETKRWALRRCTVYPRVISGRSHEPKLNSSRVPYQFGAKLTGSMTGVQNSNRPGGVQGETGVRCGAAGTANICGQLNGAGGTADLYSRAYNGPLFPHYACYV